LSSDFAEKTNKNRITRHGRQAPNKKKDVQRINKLVCDARTGT